MKCCKDLHPLPGKPRASLSGNYGRTRKTRSDAVPTAVLIRNYRTPPSSVVCSAATEILGKVVQNNGLLPFKLEAMHSW